MKFKQPVFFVYVTTAVKWRLQRKRKRVPDTAVWLYEYKNFTEVFKKKFQWLKISKQNLTYLLHVWIYDRCKIWFGNL